MRGIKFFSFLLLIAFYASNAFPLSTKSRWIMDDSTGKRVKLAGVNWPGHMEVMLPEGLHRQPLSHIAIQLNSMGFNLVRLTWATHMFTRYSKIIVSERFNDLGLHNALDGIAKNNPQLLNMTLVDAQKAVIDELGAHGVMVLLDNQVSKPMWCCGNNDGNGFFGDEYFDTTEWLNGLRIVSSTYEHTPSVVGMSLRNELRGPRQEWGAWYQFMESGVKAIHSQNPNVLILISGLSYDLDLSSLKQKPLSLNFTNKLVYEIHRYPFSNGDNWVSQPINQLCENLHEQVEKNGGFLFKGVNAAPMVITEWGINESGESISNNLFLSCYLMYLAENDLDWVLWSLAGSYYLRAGKQDMEDVYGLLKPDWTTLRNPDFKSKLDLIQMKIQDPDSIESYMTIYHPKSGLSLQVNNSVINAINFSGSSRWSHDGESTPIRLMGSNYCLQATGDGLPVSLSTDCVSERSAWRQYSLYQIQNKDDMGNLLCLEYDPNYSPNVVIKKCLEPDYHLNTQVQNQWFKLITTNVN